MPRRKPHSVVILPARAGADTAPPAAPAALALRRFWLLMAPAVPFVLAEVVAAYQRGDIPVPARWATLVAILVGAYLSYMKFAKEKGSTEDAAHLAAQGLPVGQPLDATAVKLSLTSDFRMPPDAVAPRWTDGS